ncbi:MAG: hypothetical protein Q7U47_15975 [Paludibacter sp.]|nr:hypothetical protein [Paludibacter sp.]
MRKKRVKYLGFAFFAVLATTNVKAQEFTVKADIVSSYVWRGVQFSGVSVQPTLQFSTGGFSIGSWGSAGMDGFLEMDLYAKYTFDFGLTLGLTDYYYPKKLTNESAIGHEYFDFSTATGSHGFEVNLNYTLDGLSIAANYMLNEAGGAATKGGDKYFEFGYTFDKFSIFAGAGDGWHTPTGSFGLVNVGVSSSKEIKITDTFSVPVRVSAILNPTSKQYFLVAVFTL